MSIKKILKKVTLVFIAFFLITSISAPLVSAPAFSETLQEKLDRLENEIGQIQNDKNSLENQIANNEYLVDGYNAEISALYGEVLVFQKEINELELKIEELETSIEIISEQIEEKEEEIDTLFAAINKLESESQILIKSNYYDYRLYGGDLDGSDVINTENIASFYKDSQYKELIQADTNSLLLEVASLRLELEESKKELDERLANIQEDKAEIDFQKKELDIKKGELDLKLATYYSEVQALQANINANNQQILVFSQEEAEKWQEAERVRQEIFNSFNPIADGQYVTAGTPIGNQGCTGLCTGPHLHFIVWVNGGYQNPCNYIAACGGGGLSMPIQSSYNITSYYGDRCFDWGGQLYCDWHNGLDLQGNPSNAVIYAAHSGYAYKGVDPYGALYVIVCETAGCGSGFKTGYWHLSSY